LQSCFFGLGVFFKNVKDKVDFVSDLSFSGKIFSQCIVNRRSNHIVDYKNINFVVQAPLSDFSSFSSADITGTGSIISWLQKNLIYGSAKILYQNFGFF